MILDDFGAITVIYRIPLRVEGPDLLSLSEALYENEQLLLDSRQRVEALLTIIQPALSKAGLSAFVEDYVIFHVAEFSGGVTAEEITGRYGLKVAQILRAESLDLSNDEVKDALSHHISYTNDDVTVTDWNAALVMEKDPEDVIAVLEFANVELLEMRFLDQRLDEALGLAYERLSKRPRKWFSFDPSGLREISQWQVDSAILFEGVNNALKLLGDQYMARVYRLVAERFHLTDWDVSILRKLDTLQSIYQKISDHMVERPWKYWSGSLLLVVVSIALPFVTGIAH